MIIEAMDTSMALIDCANRMEEADTLLKLQRDIDTAKEIERYGSEAAAMVAEDVLWQIKDAQIECNMARQNVRLRALTTSSLIMRKIKRWWKLRSYNYITCIKLTPLPDPEHPLYFLFPLGKQIQVAGAEMQVVALLRIPDDVYFEHAEAYKSIDKVLKFAVNGGGVVLQVSDSDFDEYRLGFDRSEHRANQARQFVSEFLLDTLNVLKGRSNA